VIGRAPDAPGQELRDAGSVTAATDRFANVEAPVRVTVHGEVSEAAKQQAVDKLLRVARAAPRTVRGLTVTLVREPDPARLRPCVAKASIDVDGRVVRGHVAAPEMAQAIELLEEHMSRRLRDLAERDETRRTEPSVVSPGEWRHGVLRADRPEYFPRAPEERKVVRRKTYAGGPETVEEAAWEMRMLDHEFFLFTNSLSNEENVVYVGADDVLHVRQPAPTGEAFVDPVIVDGDPAPVVTAQAAIELFDVADGTFLFFVDAETGRGNVLYRRYDGHYGLILPTD
jgi:ribosome-associated translation inhibitor RaiA